MPLKPSHHLRSRRTVSTFSSAFFALGLIAGAANADPLTNALPSVDLQPVQGAVSDLTATAAGAAPATSATRTMAGANAVSFSGGMNEGLRYTDAFFMERATNPYIDDPGKNSRKPVKMGFALFSADAGDFEVSLSYAGRFNGDFQEHHGGLRLTWKIPPN